MQGARVAESSLLSSPRSAISPPTGDTPEWPLSLFTNQDVDLPATNLVTSWPVSMPASSLLTADIDGRGPEVETLITGRPVDPAADEVFRAYDDFLREEAMHENSVGILGDKSQFTTLRGTLAGDRLQCLRSTRGLFQKRSEKRPSLLALGATRGRS